MSERPKMRMYKDIMMILVSVLVLTAITVETVHSRQRGGGNRSNVSKSGPAHTGSMNQSRAYKSGDKSGARTTNQGTRQQSKQTNAQDRQTNRGDNANDRQDYRDDTRDDRQDYRDDSRDDRQDHHDDVRKDRQDYYDDHRYRHGRYYYNDDDWLKAFTAGTIIAVGTAVAVSSFQSTSCPEATKNHNGVTYYKCGSTWYTKGYQSGDVVYIASEPPPG